MRRREFIVATGTAALAWPMAVLARHFEGLHRANVLIKPQHILWVVFFLDLHQTSVVRPVGGLDELFARVTELVDVHSMRKRLQVVARRLDPPHHIGLPCGSAPDTGHIYLITRLPQSKRRITQTDAANCTAQGQNDQLARCRRIVDGRGNRRNGGLA